MPESTPPRLPTYLRNTTGQHIQVGIYGMSGIDSAGLQDLEAERELGGPPVVLEPGANVRTRVSLGNSNLMVRALRDQQLVFCRNYLLPREGLFPVALHVDIQTGVLEC